MSDRELAEQIFMRVAIAAEVPARMLFPPEDCGVDWNQYLDRVHAKQLEMLRRQKRQLMTAALRMRRNKGLHGSLFMRTKA